MVNPPLDPSDIAYMLFGIEPISLAPHIPGVRAAKRIVRLLQTNQGETIGKLASLGLIKRQGGGPGLACSWAGRRLKLLLEELASMKKPLTVYGSAPGYDPIALLHYISRNLFSLGLSMSGRLRSNKDDFQRYVEDLFSEGRLTFIHVAISACMDKQLNIPEQALSENLEQLVGMGLFSHRLKLRPLGKWVMSLVKGYLLKNRLIRNPQLQQEWNRVFDWRPLERTPS